MSFGDELRRSVDEERERQGTAWELSAAISDFVNLCRTENFEADYFGKDVEGWEVDGYSWDGPGDRTSTFAVTTEGQLAELRVLGFNEPQWKRFKEFLSEEQVLAVWPLEAIKRSLLNVARALAQKKRGG